MSGRKILLVEQEHALRDGLKADLEADGHQVFLATDGNQGFLTASRELPDLIISDAELPDSDSHHFVKKLRGTSFGKSIPTIVVSARKNTKDYFELIGVEVFLEKPFDAADLLNRARRILKQPRQSRLTESNKRILIIGNDAENVEQMAAQLRANGHHTDFVNTAEQAISKAVLFLPNLIILNAEMMGMRANEIVKVLRQMPQFKKISILMYCAFRAQGVPKDDLRQKELHTSILANSCLDDGATEFIGRYDPNLFLSKLERHLTRATIVVIDDDSQVTLQLKVQLEKSGYRVHAARDAEGGLELVREHRPHLILLDIILPNADGYVALKNLKNDPQTKYIPVIVISVNGSGKDIDKALDLGADDIMLKPLHLGLVLKRIQHFLE